MNDQINTFDCYATGDREGNDSLNTQTDDQELRGEINVLEAETVWETQQTRELLQAVNNIPIRFVNPTETSQSELRGGSSNSQGGLASTSHIYQSTDHATTLLRQLNQQRREGNNCDLTLRCGCQKSTVHKAVLAASSPYFCNMIQGITQTTHSATVVIPDLDEKAFGQLMDYIYTGELCITTEMVQNLLVTARILRLQEAETACWTFLEHRLDSNTCLSICRLAELMGRSELAVSCLRYIAQHFECIEEKDDLLLLSESQFTQLISSENMGNSEDNRLKAIIRWVNHDCASRQHLADNLCRKVQVTRLSRDYLENLSEANELWAGAPWLTSIVFRALRHHLPSPREPAPQLASRLQYYRSKNSTQSPIIVVVGGYPGGTAVDCFDLKRQLWTSSSTEPNTLQQDPHSSPIIPALPCNRYACAAVAVDDLLYVLGGCPNPNGVYIYEQHNRRWIAGPEMQDGRVYLGATVLDRKVYAIGGEDDHNPHNSAEVLEPRSGVWRRIAPMTCVRSELGVTAFNNCIFAVGGRGNDCSRLSTAESYNPDTNKWTRIAQLSTPRCDLGLCVLGNRIYAVGGWIGGDFTPITEVYSPETDSWQAVAPMNKSRDGLGLVSYNGCLYAIGGYKQDSVERYDPTEDKWTILPSRMKSYRAYAGVTLFRLKRSG